MGQELSTEDIVAYEVFTAEASHTAWLLREAAGKAAAAGDDGRAGTLRAAARKVAGDSSGVPVAEAGQRTVELRRLRDELLG